MTLTAGAPFSAHRSSSTHTRNAPLTAGIHPVRRCVTSPPWITVLTALLTGATKQPATLRMNCAGVNTGPGSRHLTLTIRLSQRRANDHRGRRLRCLE
jgi:hypothetical protein